MSLYPPFRTHAPLFRTGSNPNAWNALSKGAIACGVMIVALALSLGATTVQAQGGQTRARRLYATAQALFDSGQFAQAEASFRAAYAAQPHVVVLQAIAAAQEQQGNIAGAVQTLQSYLSETPDSPQRAEIEAHLAELAARPSVLTVTSTPEGAAIFVDGTDTGQVTPSDVSMPPGAHQLEVRLEGYQAMAQEITAQAATRMRLDVPLQAATGAQDVFGEQGGDGQGAEMGGGDEEPSASTGPSALVWATAGIGGAGLIGGTVLGFLALSEQSDYDATPSVGAADRGETFALVADISFGVAAAMGITSIVLYAVEQSSSREDTAASREDELQLTVAPWAHPQGAGVAGRLRF